jgi:hypothetical protein
LLNTAFGCGRRPRYELRRGGATFVERHVTLDRAIWGSDQAASVEILGLHRLVRNSRDIEQSLGDGVKRVYESEMGALRKLRRVPGGPVPAFAPVWCAPASILEMQSPRPLVPVGFNGNGRK